MKGLRRLHRRSDRRPDCQKGFPDKIQTRTLEGQSRANEWKHRKTVQMKGTANHYFIAAMYGYSSQTVR